MDRENTLDIGERFSSGVVTICDADTVYLESRLSPVRAGTLRMVGAIASVAAGAAILWVSSVHYLGLKGLAAGLACITVCPFFMTKSYTASWGATRLVSHGGPGLVFEEYSMFFVPRRRVIALDELVSLSICQRNSSGGAVAGLYAVLKTGKKRQLATGSTATYEEQRLRCLRSAIVRALGAVTDRRA